MAAIPTVELRDPNGAPAIANVSDKPRLIAKGYTDPTEAPKEPEPKPKRPIRRPRASKED